MSRLSIVFAGTSEFAVTCFAQLVKNPAFEITLVITQPDRPVGRKHVLTAPPMKKLALRHGIPVFQPEKLNKEWSESEWKDLKPDFLVVVAYGQILSEKILSIPTRASINVHGSLLPRWRGASPIHHAILAGDTETGVTTQVMAKELDAGPILQQASTTIDPRETFTSLYAKLAELGAPLLEKTLLEPLNPQVQPTEGMTICGLLERRDGECNATTMTAEEIDRKVRALTPWPGVTMPINGVTVKVLETDLVQNAKALPVTCTDGSTLYVTLLQEPGKKPMSGADWERGR